MSIMQPSLLVSQRLIAVALVILTVVGFPGVSFAGLPPVDRSHDPVVLTGEVLPSFLGVDPDTIVGFRYYNGWDQIPVQVDERDVRDIASPYGAGAGVYRWTYPTDPSNPTALFYTDEDTELGVDTDADFDADDELVFMASDLGTRATSNFPDDVNGEIQLNKFN